MATVVNTTPATGTSDNGMGFVIGMILLVVVIAALLFYGLPYLRGGYSGGTGASSGSSINVPDHMNVNVQHSGSGK